LPVKTRRGDACLRQPVVSRCRYTISMLFDPDVVLSVVFGKNGGLEQISIRKGYVDMCTVDATTLTKISDLRSSYCEHNQMTNIMKAEHQILKCNQDF